MHVHGMLRVSMVAVAILALSATGTSAANFFDDFENYPFNEDIVGQPGPPGGWVGWDNTATAGAPVKDDQYFSGNRSVMIVGPDTDLVHEFSGVASGIWEISAMQYVPSGGGGISYFIIMNEYTAGGDPKDWAAQLRADMAAGEFVSDVGGEQRTPLVLDDWAEIKVLVDLDANTAEVSYNGTSLGGGPWATGDGGNTVAIAAVDLWPDSAAALAYYDDVSVTLIPEPATLAMLLGLGVLGVLAYVRRGR